MSWRETSGLNLQFPIRFKIVLLILAALSASLISYIYVGTQLIVEDKVSYIYDYTLAEVKSASDKVESRLQSISSVGRMIGNLLQPAAPLTIGPALRAPDRTAAAKTLFDQYAKELGITGALLLSPVDADHFKAELELGDGGSSGGAHYSNALAQLGWTPQAFEKDSLLIGTPLKLAGDVELVRVPIGVRTSTSDGKPLAFFTLCQMDQTILQDGGKNYEIRVMDPLGKTLLAKPAAGGTLAPDEFDAFAKTLVQGTFDSGVRDWSTSGKSFITSYQRLASKRLTVVSLISKDTAFAAARQLVTRSLFLGVSILFLAMGIALLSARSLTSRLREMWHATQKVSQGDFTVRVNSLKLPRDEVGGLARSFNAMADKISELMIQTAQKARMEKELETAQAVQSRFFPEHAFEHASVTLAGQYMPASECAGDWWHYARLGSQLVVVVGDVTGHGVSAALVTAAAHSTFSLLMKQFAARPDPTVDFKTLITSLNSSVIAAAGGKSTMTFVASIIDLDTGTMTYSNASHPPFYIYRKPPGSESTNPLSLFKPLLDGRIAPLGDAQEIQVESATYQLQPGDRIFWYTDGIMESRPSDGGKMNKSTFLRLLAAKAADPETPAEQICKGVMAEALEFFGAGVADRPDDITLIVASIPAQAHFEVAKPAA